MAKSQFKKVLLKSHSDFNSFSVTLKRLRDVKTLEEGGQASERRFNTCGGKIIFYLKAYEMGLLNIEV